MTPNHQDFPIRPTTDPAWVYDENGQTIWMGDPKDGKKIADVRGWGWLQYTPDAEAKQDANGRLIAEAGLAHRASGKSPIERMELCKVTRLEVAYLHQGDSQCITHSQCCSSTAGRG
jgi:hypothetical protein